jgi:carboxymethylenebutenolidase
MRNPILGLFGGADGGIPPEAIAAFADALTRAGVEHRIRIFDGAPHSFFDRKAADFAEASEAAWAETLTFIRGRTPSPIGGG